MSEQALFAGDPPSGIYRPQIITAGRFTVMSISATEEDGYEVMLKGHDADPGEYTRIEVGFCMGELEWWKARLGKQVELRAHDV